MAKREWKAVGVRRDTPKEEVLRFLNIFNVQPGALQMIPELSTVSAEGKEIELTAQIFLYTNQFTPEYL